jgi:hypothetical protein
MHGLKGFIEKSVCIMNCKYFCSLFWIIQNSDNNVLNAIEQSCKAIIWISKSNNTF